jgi:hypothetical protein
MKKFIVIFLIAFAMIFKNNAQCPISELIFATDLETMANLIDENTDCFKEKLQQPDFVKYKKFVDYLYNNSYPWVYHTNQSKEKLFENFYKNYGGLAWPTITSPKPCLTDQFYVAISNMVATDTAFFAKKDANGIPLKYIQWLRVRSLKQKYGEASVNHLMASVSKIANL